MPLSAYEAASVAQSEATRANQNGALLAEEVRLLKQHCNTLSDQLARLSERLEKLEAGRRRSDAG